MNLSELEVGNIISLDGLPVAVVDRDQERGLVTVRRKSGYIARMPLEMLCPIMITPYFLVLSLRFELVGGNQVILKRQVGERWVTAVQTELHTWCLLTDGGEIMEVMWLHQVQNFIRFL